MAMVILSYGICLSLGACVGFLEPVFAPVPRIRREVKGLGT